jgi:hypothetical protein
MNPRMRALDRLLYLHKQQHLSDEQWLAMHKLPSHRFDQPAKHSMAIIHVSIAAKSHTSTQLGLAEIRTLYCTVRMSC